MPKNELFVPGKIINERYFIKSLIAAGGIAKTYLCNDQKTGTIVVLKVLKFREAEDWKMVELFEREAEILKKINHPNIPYYIDYFSLEEDEELYLIIVQQYVEGKNLKELIEKRTPFSETEIFSIFNELLNILEYLHTQNPAIIHRDVNPKNIILDSQGKIYLVDFGAVGHIQTETIAAAMSNTFVGTIGFMPQEQLFGKVAPQTDIYSLGVTMIYLITGKHPSEMQVKKGKLDFHSFAGIPERLKKVLDKMIEPFIENRLKSISEIREILNSSSVSEKTIKSSVYTSPANSPVVPHKNKVIARVIIGFTLLYVFIIFNISYHASQRSQPQNFQVKILDYGVTVWNRWRRLNPELHNIDLQRINLKGRNLRGINFSGVNLYYANLQDCDLRNSRLDHANLYYADLRGGKFQNSTFKFSQFQHTKCENASFNHGDFENAYLYYSDFSYSDMRNAKFIKANLNQSKFINTLISGSDFSYADLKYIEMQFVSFKECHFNYAVFRYAKLNNLADLSSGKYFKTDFSYINANDIDFSNCDLKKAKFNHATLNRAKFVKADLTGAKLEHTRLEGANFTDAIMRNITNMRHCYFEDANFSGADLRELNLQYVNFSEVKLDNAQLNQADLYYAHINVKYKDYLKNQNVMNYDSIRWVE